MIKTSGTSKNRSHSSRLENYYRFHSRIYDATRWSFLFGREAILDFVPDLPSRPRILEIGCGTGKNIELMEYHFSDANILGVDLSEEMLSVAQTKLQDSKKVKFRKQKYGAEELDEEPFDLILLSYSLTMIGNQVEEVLDQISKDLKPKGYIAVVDFHTSSYGWFRHWMDFNHVDLSGHLLSLIQKYFRPVETEVNSAYLGLWSYFLFLGSQN